MYEEFAWKLTLVEGKCYAFSSLCLLLRCAMYCACEPWGNGIVS